MWIVLKRCVAGVNGSIFWFPYLPKCPVSFGWMFGPVDRLRVLLPSEISTEIRRRRWSLVSWFLGHKGYALRKATATIRARFVCFLFTCLFPSFSPLLGCDPWLLALVLFLLAFICRGRGELLLLFLLFVFFSFSERIRPYARTVQCWEIDACCW